MLSRKVGCVDMCTTILLLAWGIAHGISVCWGMDGWFLSSVICLGLTSCFLVMLGSMWWWCVDSRRVPAKRIFANVDAMCQAAGISTLPMIIVELLFGGWLLGIFDFLLAWMLIGSLIGDGLVFYRWWSRKINIELQQKAAEDAAKERRRQEEVRRIAEQQRRAEAEKERMRQETARRNAELRRNEEKEAAAKRKRQKDEEEILKIMRDRALSGEALPANVGCMTPTMELHDAHAYD